MSKTVCNINYINLLLFESRINWMLMMLTFSPSRNIVTFHTIQSKTIWNSVKKSSLLCIRIIIINAILSSCVQPCKNIRVRSVRVDIGWVAQFLKRWRAMPLAQVRIIAWRIFDSVFAYILYAFWVKPQAIKNSFILIIF